MTPAPIRPTHQRNAICRLSDDFAIRGNIVWRPKGGGRQDVQLSPSPIHVVWLHQRCLQRSTWAAISFLRKKTPLVPAARANISRAPQNLPTLHTTAHVD